MKVKQLALDTTGSDGKGGISTLGKSSALSNAPAAGGAGGVC